MNYYLSDTLSKTAARRPPVSKDTAASKQQQRLLLLHPSSCFLAGALKTALLWLPLHLIVASASMVSWMQVSVAFAVADGDVDDQSGGAVLAMEGR